MNLCGSLTCLSLGVLHDFPHNCSGFLQRWTSESRSQATVTKERYVQHVNIWLPHLLPSRVLPVHWRQTHFPLWFCAVAGNLDDIIQLNDYFQSHIKLRALNMLIKASTRKMLEQKRLCTRTWVWTRLKTNWKITSIVEQRLLIPVHLKRIE